MCGARVGAALLVEQHTCVLWKALGCSWRAAPQSLVREVSEGEGRWRWLLVWRETSIHGSHKALWPGSKCLVQVLSMMSEYAQCCTDW